jgi:hypothetical protein
MQKRFPTSLKRFLSPMFFGLIARSFSDLWGSNSLKGEGSRVRIVLNGVRAVFHRPHPRKEIDKGALVSLKRFLGNAGIVPEEKKI